MQCSSDIFARQHTIIYLKLCSAEGNIFGLNKTSLKYQNLGRIR